MAVGLSLSEHSLPVHDLAFAAKGPIAKLVCLLRAEAWGNYPCYALHEGRAQQGSLVICLPAGIMVSLRLQKRLAASVLKVSRKGSPLQACYCFIFKLHLQHRIPFMYAHMPAGWCEAHLSSRDLYTGGPPEGLA